MNQPNGNDQNVSVIEPVQSDIQTTETSATFYDSSNPVLKPARPIDTRKKKTWKRRIIGWSFILILIAAGVAGLYFLLKVSRVNVTVQANSRRETQGARANTNSSRSETGLTAEAINIAREAAGPDSTTPKSNSSGVSSGESSVALPSPDPGVTRDLSYTGNSPAYESNVVNASAKAPSQSNDSGQEKSNSNQTTVVAKSHANTTQSLFVEDPLPKPAIVHQTNREPQPRPTPQTKPTLKTPTAVLPPFGTLLPVTTQGAIFTLRDNSYARLELSRESKGEGWSLPKGTILIGRTSGSEYDRAFVNVVGYIDPRENKLVKMTGEVIGSDGASGVQGKRIGTNRNRFKETLRKVASNGLQVAGMMAGALGGGPVVVDGTGYRVLNPITDEARRIAGAGNDKNTFVKVEAGRSAYVMVVELPKTLQGVDALGEVELTSAALSLSDREVMELIIFGTPEEISAALPMMTDDQKRLALKTANERP